MTRTKVLYLLYSLYSDFIGYNLRNFYRIYSLRAWTLNFSNLFRKSCDLACIVSSLCSMLEHSKMYDPDFLLKPSISITLSSSLERFPKFSVQKFMEFAPLKPQEMVYWWVNSMWSMKYSRLGHGNFIFWIEKTLNLRKNFLSMKLKVTSSVRSPKITSLKYFPTTFDDKNFGFTT